ncbi:MAG: histidine kinase dimerization/phosphoacceptor domain -containing protein [Arcobacteraceae bacterium]|jgi:PAS domain S-box-containing protein|nr:histidine kinase dimerization/phosphoacceptor domain -containing protein [Arcobacteraceae bacterium]
MQKDQQLSLRKEAETKLEAKNINSLLPKEKLSPEKMEKLVHELEVHQIELEMQNEELTRTQLELNIAKNLYFDLYDMAPIGYCMLDGDGLIQEANVSVANLLGVNRQQLIKQPIVQFIYRDDQDIYYFLKKRLLETGFKEECELRMYNAQGVPICVHLIVSSQKDSNNNQHFRLILSDISKQKEQEKQLLIAENIVKKELHHSVKNNMQLILSLFKLKLAPFINSDIQRVIKEVTYKIQGMASVHDMLYKQKILKSIDVSQYFSTLVNALKNGYETEHIQFDLKIDAQLSSDQLIFCGLIVNEVVMNSIKYAFNDTESQRGWIVSLHIYSDEKQTILEISDNGRGMDESRKISFGSEMIESLIRNELKGKMKLETDKGVKYTFYIPR